MTQKEINMLKANIQKYKYSDTYELLNLVCYYTIEEIFYGIYIASKNQSHPAFDRPCNFLITLN